jgi:hypothetical protein
MNASAMSPHPLRRGQSAPSVLALGSQHDSRSGFIGRELSFVHGPARLPSISPLAAVLVSLVDKPIHRLFGRRERDPDTSVLDHNGFFPTGRKHARLPRRLLNSISNSARVVFVPYPSLLSRSSMNKSSGYPHCIPGSVGYRAMILPCGDRVALARPERLANESGFSGKLFLKDIDDFRGKRNTCEHSGTTAPAHGEVWVQLVDNRPVDNGESGD